MFARLFLLFTFTSLLEIYVLVQVGGLLGVWPTIGLVIITALVGSSLVRSQGLQTMFNVQSRMQQGEMPGKELIEAMMLVIAGVLLVTPGFVTDFCGLMLLQPSVRGKLAEQALAKLSVNMVAGAGFNGGFHHSGFQGGGFQGGFSTDHIPSDEPPAAKPGQTNGNKTTIEGEYERKD